MSETVYCRHCKLPITDKYPANPYYPDMHLAFSSSCIKLMRAKLALALAALRKVEWLDIASGWKCPFCLREVPFGALKEHAPDCPRQLALGIGTDEMVNYG